MSARVTTLALTLVLAVLAGGAQPGAAQAPAVRVDGAAALRHVERLVAIGPRVAGSPGGERARAYIVGELRKRSEEHTSELQSRSDLVCRLLLEKKKETVTLIGATAT